MKRMTVRQFKDDMAAVLDRVAAGESVEIWHRCRLVAVLSPPRRKGRLARPDFAARLRRIYGRHVMKIAATELIAECRGMS